MNRRNFVIGTGAIATSVGVGSLALTSATVERSVNIGVATDNAAVVGLIPGSTSAASLANGDQLEIDTSTSNANGLNTEATFEYGDPANPTSTNLFSIVNNSGSEQEFTVEFARSSSGDGSVTFELYDNSGSSVGNVTTSQSQTFTLSSAAQYYVVMTVDTTGTADGDQLGGTLTFSVN